MNYSNLVNSFENQVENLINKWGRQITIIYGSTATCNSCSYDPVNKEATNIACSTCSGLYYYQIENTKYVKGIIKTFVGNFKHNDYILNSYGYIPEHEARITCWLEDTLYNYCSATGSSYLDVDKNIRVEVDSKKYRVKATYRSGADNLKVIIATLEEIKN